MPPVIDEQIKPKTPLWKVILNMIYSGLGALKAMGKFNKGAGPKFIKTPDEPIQPQGRKPANRKRE